METLKKILFASLVFASFFVTVELFLRVVTTGSLYFLESNPHILDEKGSFGLKPDNETWWYGFHYRVNAHGFRMPREVGPKRNVRVVALGDSITEGIGVRDSDNTWPMQLERLAAARGTRIESINTGIQGWDLLNRSEEGLVSGPFVRFLKESVPELEPDIVVWAICLNDTPSAVHEVWAEDNRQNRRRFQLFPERSREWLKRKALYRLLRDTYREARFHGLDYSSVPSLPDSPRLWSRVSTEIAEMKATVEALDAQLFAVIVPYSYQILTQNRNLLTSNEHWHRALTEHGIAYRDLSARLDAEDVLDYFALGDYIHPNAKGHGLIAEAALELIRGELELKQARLEP